MRGSLLIKSATARRPPAGRRRVSGPLSRTSSIALLMIVSTFVPSSRSRLLNRAFNFSRVAAAVEEEGVAFTLASVFIRPWNLPDFSAASVFWLVLAGSRDGRFELGGLISIKF